MWPLRWNGNSIGWIAWNFHFPLEWSHCQWNGWKFHAIHSVEIPFHPFHFPVTLKMEIPRGFSIINVTTYILQHYLNFFHSIHSTPVDSMWPYLKVDLNCVLKLSIAFISINPFFVLIPSRRHNWPKNGDKINTNANWRRHKPNQKSLKNIDTNWHRPNQNKWKTLTRTRNATQ